MKSALHIVESPTLMRGISYAEACFETFRVIQGKVLAWQAHWARLSKGLLLYGITLPDTAQAQIWNAIQHQCDHVTEDCLVRLTIAGGEACWGLFEPALPVIYIQALPFTANTAEKHLHTMTYPFALRPKLAKFSSDYAEYLRAIVPCKIAHPSIAPQDYLWCKQGIILGTLTANILLLVDDVWLSPAGDGILPGILQQQLIQHALVKSADCPIEMLEQAQAMLLSNCGQLLQVVGSVNGRTLSTKHPDIAHLQTTVQQWTTQGDSDV